MSYWDERYGGDDYVFGTAPNRFLARHAGLIAPGACVFLPGDGEGRNGVFLAGGGAVVTSMDLSPVGADKARRLAASQGVALEVVVGDIADWPWPEAAYDAVAAIFIQFAPPALRDRIFAGIRRSLKPGGLALVHGYTPKQLEFRTGGPSVLEQFYTEAMLREAFAGFEILELRSYEDVLDEGTAHSGPSALIDLVARKPRA